MKNFVFFYFPFFDYLVSCDVFTQYTFINNKTKDIFKKHNINALYFYEFLELKDQLKYSDIQENYKLSTINDIDIINNDIKSVLNLIKKDIETNDTEYILFGYEVFAFKFFFTEHYCDLFGYDNNCNIKRITLHHDFHSESEHKQDNNYFNYSNNKFDRCDLICSPTVWFFNNINSKYLNKTEFIPFSYNSNNNKIFELQQFDEYFNREKKIISTGAIDAYKHRKLINYIKNDDKIFPYLQENIINLNLKDEFSKIIEIYPSNKYNRNNTKYNEERGIHYLRKLSKYMGAFVCFADFPLSFPLLKLWEIMLAGCLAFIEPNDFLQIQIGLIPYVHYVPMLIDNNNKLIIDMEYYNKYLGTDEGLKIAKQGFEYIRDNFTDEKITEKYCEILNKRNFLIPKFQTKKIITDDYDCYKYFYIFGDSHCLCFGQGDVIVKNTYNIQMLNQDSSTARGLINPNSTLKYGEHIEHFIKFKNNFGNKPFNTNEKFNYYVFKFGQVDIQVNYYYKKIIKNEIITKDIFFNEVINSYIYYITFLNRFKNYNILVCGINMPSPTSYKSYLYKVLKLDEIHKNELLDSITLEELNNDTILFNNLLKQECLLNNITYFDLTDECTYINNNQVYLRPEFIGNDHHYNGCMSITNLNKYMNESTDYLNHPLYKNTYNTFINKLIRVINNKTENVLINEASILFMLYNRDYYYIYHNNTIQYNLELKIPNITINTTYNVNDKNIFIFGLKIKIPQLNECKLKIKMNSNIPIKIYDGKKWLNFNVCELNEIIQINDTNKWRISPSNEYINSNKTNTFQFIISIYELTIIY